MRMPEMLRKLGFRVWKSDGSFRKRGARIVCRECVCRLEV